jgi:hypothetical protein
MNDVSHPLALAALSKALKDARVGPTPRKHTHSRTADKFVINAFAELLGELTAIGSFQGRSTNSEIVAATMEALAGYQRTETMLRILKSYVGENVAERVLAEVPDFDLEECRTRKKFVVRLPDQVREQVREGVTFVLANGQQQEKKISMNKWLLNALVAWVKIQRQHYALLSAVIAMDQTQICQSA